MPAVLRSALLALSLFFSACDSDRAADPSGSDDIPAVSGLSASLDTASGVITLTWQATDYPGLDRYVIYRLLEGESSPPLAVAIGSARDTFFVDSVRQAFPVSALTLTYRVRIMDSLERVGVSSSPVILHVPPVDTRHPLALPYFGDVGWRLYSFHAIGNQYLAFASKEDSLQAWTYDPASKSWHGGSSWKPWEESDVAVKVVPLGGAYYIFASYRGTLLIASRRPIDSRRCRSWKA